MTGMRGSILEGLLLVAADVLLWPLQSRLGFVDGELAGIQESTVEDACVVGGVYYVVF